MCDALHHLADRSAWLAKLAAEMKPGARLVLIGFKEGNLPEGPPETAKIARAQMLELVTQAGLRPASERADLLPRTRPFSSSRSRKAGSLILDEAPRVTGPPSGVLRPRGVPWTHASVRPVTRIWIRRAATSASSSLRTK
jgi:hypothetical protein